MNALEEEYEKLRQQEGESLEKLKEVKKHEPNKQIQKQTDTYYTDFKFKNKAEMEQNNEEIKNFNKHANEMRQAKNLQHKEKKYDYDGYGQDVRDGLYRKRKKENQKY